MAMLININGEIKKIETDSLQEMLLFFKIKKDAVAVELNGEIVPRSSYSDTKLNDGDKIEIVSFVGGG
jgi:sulfur carrier protein